MSEDLLINKTQCTFYEWSRDPQHATFFRIFSIISVLTVLVFVVVLGNALVIAAVLLRRRLRSATGLLILSLGVADLMVGIVILPFSIANEVLSGYWIFGDTWCTIWVTMDIWMCTASIYNLVAISIDRYIAIIKPLNYPMLVTKFRARCIVALVWIGSFLICSPSFFVGGSSLPEDKCKCSPASAGRAYIIFSASSSFYVPMIVVIFVYFRIYIAARAATKSIYSGMMQVTANANKNTKSYLLNHPSVLAKESLPMLRVHRGSSVASIRPSNIVNKHLSSSQTTMNGSTAYSNAALARNSYSPSPHQNGPAPINSLETPENDMEKQNGEMDLPASNEKRKRKNTDSDSKSPSKVLHSINPLKKLIRRGQIKKAGCAYEKRLSLEIKAAKTVAIVTGCFIFCWLGFALMYGLELETDDVTWSIVFWLGYLNSALNPVIYTVFNREFRTCFKRLLTCHHLNHPNTTKYTNNSYNSIARTGMKNRASSSPPQMQMYSTNPMPTSSK
ncbi:unnamed protein product [Auanema sp. JU1783]|nr:unnamed protein product [Auanema sp. JU1783]